MSSAWPSRAMRKARAARATSAARRPSRAAPPPRSTDSRCSPMRSRIAPDNTTRFLVVGRKLFSPSGADRTTLLVSASDTDDAGALFRLLEPLAEHRVNMTRIESRPSRKRKWDYVFFIDVEGHVSDPPLAKALASLERRASLVQGARVLSAGRALMGMARRRARFARAAVAPRGRRARRARRQVDLAPLAHAVGDRRGHEQDQRLPGERGLPGEPCGDARAWVCASSSRSATRGAGARRRLARPEGRGARARHGQCRHGDPAVHRPAWRRRRSIRG